jgi:hypothetical protein
MLPKKSAPGRRFVHRVVALLVIGGLTVILHSLDQQGGSVTWVMLELGIWCWYFLYELDTQIFRLKSRPDSEAVSFAETLQWDSMARVVLAGYFLVVLLLVLYCVFQ